MLLPIKEISNCEAHHQFVASYNSSLMYQLQKVLYLTKEVETYLDIQSNSSRWYIDDPRLSYSLDNLINNLSVLTEYYHGWIIFCHIGTTVHKKVKYTLVKNDSELDTYIEEIFKRHSIGILQNKENTGAYYKKCKAEFMRAYEYLLTGKAHEVYVINNFLKHNAITMKYAPKIFIDDNLISAPYIHINKPEDLLLNNSIFKSLFDHDLENNDTSSNTKNYYTELINSSVKHICNIGGIKIYNINGLDYFISDSTVGLSIESILQVSHELTCSIVKFVSNSLDYTSKNNQITNIIESITARKPKTINSLL
ncbi:hypothetical protein DFQ45_11185 [Thiopseudomonas denitrificans]|uniref:Uncharacterized protein n=1 Tax=Thiopseudomonas denitrificans TaxID=1501432 RepID=A0A4R6U0Y9_9GAMM|nr:hypothetical protein DFQ45_11185 [Thiopseudomonas denitrificans]